MMKKSFAALLAGGMLATAVSAADETRIGVGIGLSNDTTSIRMPIDIAKDLRIEPEFGIAYVDGDDIDTTNLLIGSGFYLMSQPSSKINLYYGGKLMIDYSSYDAKGKDDSNTQFDIGGVFGFEYLFDRHFSAGGEAGVYLGLGDSTTFNTRGMALLRYYF